MKSCRRGLSFLLLLFCGFPTPAQAPASDRLNGKSLEAAVSFAQSLAQWEFVVIGGSLLILVGTSHRSPESRLMRVPYLVFLPAWLCLGWSIYLGTQAQEAYLAYLLLPVTTLNGATKTLNEDIGNEISWMLRGLLLLLIWLIFYLFWWILTKRSAGVKENP
jgi:hypothetical protein